MRIVDYFLATAERSPDAIAFVDGHTNLSFAAARSQTLRIASALCREVTSDEPLHIAILSPNDHRITLLQLAINHADQVWVSLHARNSTQAQLETLQNLDCDILFYHSSFEAMASDILDELPQELRVICIDQSSDLGPSLGEWLGDVGEAELPPQEDPQRLMMLQPTGGTTGPSKAVGHTHHSMEHCMLALRRAYAISGQSVYLAVAPMTHAGGLFALGFLSAGARIVVLPEFNVPAVFKAIENQAVSHLFVPPTALYAMLAQDPSERPDFSSLRGIVIGAAPIAPEKFKEAVRVFGPVMYEFYGQTESLGPVLHKRPEDYLQQDGSFDEAALLSAGQPMDCVRVAIMDDSGNFLPPGESGEIVVRTSMVMAGYYQRPEETAEVSTNGWHHTTDVGSMDERGFITILDRKKDMIISGGFNLFPSEIEAVIAEHPAVLDCSVIGVPDAKWGEAVKAVVQLKDGTSATEQELITLCKSKLGSLKAPKTVDFWPELPRSAVGKVLKKDIRAHF